jgi:hypothetical protein
MTTALEGGKGSASRPGRSLPPGKTRYPLYRRLCGPQDRSGQVRKISPPPGFDPRTFQPVASHYTTELSGPTCLCPNRNSKPRFKFARGKDPACVPPLNYSNETSANSLEMLWKPLKRSTVEPGYNDIGLCDTSPISSDIVWYQLIPPFSQNIILLGTTPAYNNKKAFRDVISGFYCMCLRGKAHCLSILLQCYDFCNGVTMVVIYTVRTKDGRV